MNAKLTYSSLPNEIKKIANESLGLGVLKSLFSYSNTYHLMVKVSDGVFIGFALYHFKTISVKDGEDYTIGVIDCVCVDTPYRKEGFGTLLTFGVLRKMSAYGADRVEIVLKTPGVKNIDGEPGIPVIGSDKILNCLGFRRIKEYKDYYVKNSQKYAYDCNFCGTKPDSCIGVLYAINGRESDASVGG